MGEIIEAFVVPAPAGLRSAHVKLGPRRAHAVAKVSVAASARLVSGKLEGLRLCLGSVAPTIVRATEAEAAVEGKPVTEESLAELAAANASLPPLRPGPTAEVAAVARWLARPLGGAARSCLAQAHHPTAGDRSRVRRGRDQDRCVRRRGVLDR